MVGEQQNTPNDASLSETLLSMPVATWTGVVIMSGAIQRTTDEPQKGET